MARNWQGDGSQHEECGVPIAPHDGSNPATWSSDSNTITIVGQGAFLGLAKVHNAGEDGAPVDDTIVYNYELSEDGQSLDLTIYIGWGAWHFKMVKKPDPLVGTWKLAPEAGALEVGEAVGNYNWWSSSLGRCDHKSMFI